MENRDSTPCSHEANQASSETERPVDAFQYDNNEEMILLQMAEDNDGPPSPGLKAAMEKSQHPNEPVGQQQQQPTPLLMERPKSSGIDVTAFCFAKPSGKNFSIQSSKSSAKQPPATRETVRNELGITEAPDKQRKARKEEYSSSRSHAECQTEPSSRNDEDNHRSAKTNSPAAAQMKSPNGLDHQPEDVDDGNDSNGRVDPEQSQNAKPAGPLTTTDIQSYDSETAHRNEPGDGCPVTLGHGEKKPRKPVSHTNASTTENESFSTYLLAPSQDGSRVSKRHRARKPAGPKKSVISPVDEGTQLTEDKLFQLLVGRIRQREEDSVVAASLHKQLETIVAKLTEENKILKEELVVYGTQLQRKTLESKTYRSHIHNWKAKLGKFKVFLNVLGTDYQTLRGESIHLKATRSALDKEGKELRGNIDDIKTQISKITSTFGEKRSHLLESESIIDVLRNDLNHSEEKTRFVQDQLREERKRITTLESYIQRHSHTQGKQLGLIRADQLGMDKKMDSAFEAMVKLWETSQTAIRSILSPAMNKCLLAVNTLSEKESMDKMEIQKFTDTLHSLVSRMDTVVVQLTTDFERSSEANANRAIYLKDQIQNLGDRFGPDCDLFKQLLENKESCGSLREKFEFIVPNISTLNAAIQSFGEKETSLVQQMEEFGRGLSQTRVPEQGSSSSPEDGNDQTATAELESRLEKMSQELAMAQATLQARDSENENTKVSLLEATKMSQEAEARAAQYEYEVAILQQKIQLIEGKVREELNRASVISRDQTRAKFEQQLHKILKEKADAEKDLQKTKDFLATAQQSQLQNDASTDRRQKEMESLLLAKEQQIETLRTSSNEDATRLESQEVEMNRLRELEDFNSRQQDLLQQKIDEANQKVAALKAEAVVNASKLDRAPLQELEERLDTLQAELSHKEEERSSIQEELSAANATKLTLESGKAKAKGEIHALLLRVQDSERWMKTIKDKLEKFGISTSAEPFPETWNKLELLLQSAIASGFPDAFSNNALQQVGCTPQGGSLAATPGKLCESPSQFVQTTELIYRTKNIPRSTHPSPVGCESSAAIDTVPDSQLATNIVPFSTFQKQLSPLHCSSPRHDAGDFATILTQTPRKEYPTEISNHSKENVRGLSSSSATEKDADSLSPVKNTHGESRTSDGKNPGKQHLGADMMSENAIESRNTDYNGDKPKAVTFEDRDTVNVGSKRRMPESPFCERTAEGFATERPVRPNRRTYSRFRQTSPVGKNGNFAAENDAPPSAQNKGVDSPYDNRSKRARVATASNHSKPHKQTQGGSDYVERRASPANLASGSSRQNTANGNSSNQRWATRGPKRPGCRTRGERYNARFSQDNRAR